MIDLTNENQVPYTRVNHAKFMVTENMTYISTQNWSGDYFLTTGGLSVGLMQPDFVSQVQAIFDRDWNSEYAHPLPPTPPTTAPGGAAPDTL